MQPPSRADIFSTVGLHSFPNEVLRTVLLNVHPNDLITVAAVNRQLHQRVPKCIDHALAKRHILDRFSTHDLRSIPYDHALMLKHTVARFALCGIDKCFARSVWGLDWMPHPMADEEIRVNRVRALREGFAKREWLRPTSADTPKDPELDIDDIEALEDAAEVAGFMRSTELFKDIRRAFPGAITNDPGSVVFKRFLIPSFKFPTLMKTVSVAVHLCSASHANPAMQLPWSFF
ncbi:hypothetical protein HDU96_011090 [Phlyctochytrium bullatum]|nr:hypothetical protein HDU96_011090 [Phlyctochytrium bullatum]